MNTRMNTSLHRLFITVLVLFLILGMSTTWFTVLGANGLNNDPRNTRALYHEYSIPRGAITASDGTVLASSTPSNDAYRYNRVYSNGSLYSSVTGYFSIVSRAGGGIESAENSLLTGQNDALWWQRFQSAFTGKSNQGATIETSINPKLQKAAQAALNGRQGAVVAIEPSSGRLLALYSSPGYDPNQLSTHDTKAATNAYDLLAQENPSPLQPITTRQLMPPGSQFKLIVASAAIESGNYTEDSEIPAVASYTLPGTNTQLTNATHQWLYSSDSTMKMSDAIAYSSNTAFAQLGVTIGNSAIAAMAKKYGFNSPITIAGNSSTGTPMTAVASVFPSSDRNDRLALASIGQGDTSATPLQMAMVSAAIANKGTLMQPTLVDRVRGANLDVISQTSPTVKSRPISSDTAKQLTDMMEQVITKSEPDLQLPNAKVAAKTGTAQVGVGNSGIDAWVTGFAPADDPKIAVCVMVRNAGTFAGDTAGPVMKQIMEAALQ